MTKEEIKQIVGEAEIVLFLMEDKDKEKMRKFMELLINKHARPCEPKYDYFNGKSDAYNNIYKLFDNRMNETDDFVSLTED